MNRFEQKLAERTPSWRSRRQPHPARCRHHVGNRSDPKGRLDHDHESISRLHGDMGEIPERVVTDIRIDGRAGKMRSGAGIHEGIAIGLRARDLGRAQRAAAAGAIFDEELLAQACGKLRRK